MSTIPRHALDPRAEFSNKIAAAEQKAEDTRHLVKPKLYNDWKQQVMVLSTRGDSTLKLIDSVIDVMMLLAKGKPPSEAYKVGLKGRGSPLVEQDVVDFVVRYSVIGGEEFRRHYNGNIRLGKV